MTCNYIPDPKSNDDNGSVSKFAEQISLLPVFLRLEQYLHSNENTCISEKCIMTEIEKSKLNDHSKYFLMNNMSHFMEFCMVWGILQHVSGSLYKINKENLILQIYIDS